MKIQPLMYCVFLLFELFSPKIKSQVNWQGDTESFNISDTEISLNAEAVTASKLIYTSSEIIQNALWEISVFMDFNPSSSNYCRIYLSSDANTIPAIEEAYYLECGSSDDDIKLYKVLNGQTTLLIDGGNGMLDKSPNSFMVKVTRTDNFFSLFYLDETLSAYKLIGSIIDSSIIKSSYFMLYCNYTSSRSTLFSFKDFTIEGEKYIDTNPPLLSYTSVINDTTIHLFFDETVNIENANFSFIDIENSIKHVFCENNTIIIESNLPLPSSFSLHIDGVHDLKNNAFGADIKLEYLPAQILYADMLDSAILTIGLNALLNVDSLSSVEILANENTLNFELSSNKKILACRLNTPITEGSNLKLQIGNLWFENGQNILKFDTIIQYHKTKLFDIVLNEIFADETPTLYYVNEYIEIYNRSEYAINLSDWEIEIGTKRITLANPRIKPGGYLVISRDSIVANNQLVLDDFPTLSNDELEINIYARDETLIDQFYYLKDYLLEPYKQDGGWSLERIDFDNFQTPENWASSINNLGGTPGEENSIFASNPDFEIPKLLGIFPIDSLHLELVFNEPIQQLISSNNTKLLPLLNHSKYVQTFTNPLTQNTFKHISISATDFNGNFMLEELEIGLPKNLATNDLIINEILFDPNNDQCEFIELYNRTDSFLNSSDVFISRRNSSGFIESLIPISATSNLIGPHSYIMISKCDLGNLSLGKTYNNYSSVDLFTLSNDEETLLITDISGKVIDEVHYASEWHNASFITTKGLSLERISPNLPSDVPTSWTSASLNLGSTPGLENSQYIDLTEGNAKKIYLSNEYFTPNGDGDNDIMLLSISEDGAYSATVKIFDSNGRPVRTLCNNCPEFNSCSYSWDGTNESGSLVETGIYIIYVTVNKMKDISTKKLIITLS